MIGARCPGHVGDEPSYSSRQPERFVVSVDSLTMSAVVDSMDVGAERHFEFPFASAGEGDKLYSQLESFGNSYQHRPGDKKYSVPSLCRTTEPPGTVSLIIRRDA
jgi:hypothetical protein